MIKMEIKMNNRAVNYVVNLIPNLIGEANISVTQSGHLYTFFVNGKGVIALSDTIDDFNEAIEKHSNTSYYKRSEWNLKFKIYIALSENGIYPNILISKELLAEQQDWFKNIKVEFSPSKLLTETFCLGLIKLKLFLSELAQKYSLGPSHEIQKELKSVENLIKHYDKFKSYDESSTSEISLSYLKAAAVCEIIEKENESRSIKIERIRKEKSKEIYSIVKQLRENKYLPQIKMPECIKDYAEYHTDIVNITSTKMDPKITPMIFIACGQLYKNEKSCGLKIQALLSERGIESFFAEAANDLNSLNHHIFENLSKCSGFIAILHKREGNHNTSVWINQEVAIMAYIRFSGKKIPSLVLYEKEAERAGLIKYTIANPLEFTSEDEILSIIQSWLTGQKFNDVQNTSDIDIEIPEETKTFGSSSGGGRNAYYNINYDLKFRIRNKGSENICLEDIVARNDLLGNGKLDKTNSKLSKLPFNIESRKTEEFHNLIGFPSGVSLDKADEEIRFELELVFSDRKIKKVLKGILR